MIDASTRQSSVLSRQAADAGARRHDRPARVLVVDDSRVIREMLSRILNADARLEVVATAADAYSARREIKALKPDVVTLDVQMPEMDGIQFLRNLMRLHPMPVVMVSSFTVQGAEVTLQALDLGALDFVGKPSAMNETDLDVYARELVEKVHVASRARLRPGREPGTKTPKQPAPPQAAGYTPGAASSHIIGIGASTGGPQALRELLQALGRRLPGIVIVQHIPAAFASALAARLNSICDMTVVEARDGELIRNGHAYIAGGTAHVRIAQRAGRFYCALDDGPPVNHHKPSVDVLFEALAAQAPKHTTAALLTGMGADGAGGLKALHDAGAVTFAQSEASSAVWGMPRAAINKGAVQHIVDLDDLPEMLTRVSSPRTAGRYRCHDPLPESPT